MVFESLLTDVLNRVLGDYVENLDSKQLKVGIWGGDVVLKDLILRQSALNDLDLPVQAVYGRLTKLVLKIPWKNLYYSSVEAYIEGLYLVIEPNSQVQYDPVKEESKLFDAKQAALRRFEEARKRELEAKKKVDDTFVEKLAAQIIRNVQVTIKDIHVRYEDKTTNPGHPFSLGVTLSKLVVQTTDCDWVPTVVYDDQISTKIHKIVDLEGLSLYWNCNSPMYHTLSFEDIVSRLNNEIPCATTIPKGYDYILGPINATARLKLNPKPEYDSPPFSVPKALANLDIEKLSVGLTKSQYRDLIGLADSLELMTKGIPYRKYRPNLPSYRGYYKEWWKFAYTCVIEEEIRRVRRNWNWSNMLRHREMLKEYRRDYQTKLQTKKCPQELLNNLTRMERELDIVNIVLVRQRAHFEMERLGKLQAEEKQKKSWFSGWWSNSSADEGSTSLQNSIMTQFQAAMTADEKKRLYNAIDYEENAVAVAYPKSFVDTTCIFVLRLLEIRLSDENVEILTGELRSVKCKFDTRQAANAMAVLLNMEKLIVYGIRQDDYVPELITSQMTEKQDSLLDVTFETNPLNTNYGQRLYLTANPLKIIYHAVTINKVVDVFNVPKSTALAQLSEATASTINDVKTKSTAGLQHLIDKHVLLDLKIDVRAPYLILPYGGIYTGSENIMVVNLGHMTIISKDRPKTSIKEKQLTAQTREEMFKVIAEESYDTFNIELTELQVLLASGGEEWFSAMGESKTSKMHLLQPISLYLTFQKCLIDDDPRLPHSKISGILPSLALKVSDNQIIILYSLMTSIPFPEKEEDLVIYGQELTPVRSDIISVDKKASQALSSIVLKQPVSEPNKPAEETIQYTLLELNFVMKELSLTLCHQEYSNAETNDIAVFKITEIGCDIQSQTFINHIKFRLTNILLCKNHGNEQVDIISTPICAKEGTHLFTVNFLQVNKKCPEFKIKYNLCESLLTANFAALAVVLHQEVLQELIKFTTDLQVNIEDLQKSAPLKLQRRGSNRSLKRTLSTFSDTLTQSNIRKKRTKADADSQVAETILFKIAANLSEFVVQFTSDAGDISQFSLNNLNLDVIMKKPHTEIKAILKDLVVIDCSPNSFYPKILSVVDKEAINLQVVMFNNDPDELFFTHEDISLNVTLGGVNVVFLNLYVDTMMNFVNKFQAARAAIIEASQAAADKAKQNVADIYTNAVRIAINVHINEPKIIVPRNSQDYNALFINLGNLQAINTFLVLDIKNDHGHPAVIDELQLKLTDFQLSRILTNIKENIADEITILKPVTFSLNLKRNLSSKWYNAVPDIHVVGHIESIEINIGQPDYNMIMATLNGNLTEGVKEEVPAVKMPEVDRKLLSTASSATFMTLTHGTTAQEEETSNAVEATEQEVHIFVKFNFMMNNFIVTLLTLEDEHNMRFSFTRKRQGLARLSLEGFSIKGRILSDNTINTSVLLVDCLLDDIRPGKEDKLNRLFSRKVFGETECLMRTVSPFAFKTMMDITFKQKDNDIYLDARVSGFDLILSMDFINKLQRFFSTALESVDEPDVTEVKAKPSRMSNHSMKSRESSQEKNLSINLQLEKPDVIIVETMQSIDTNCIILNFEMMMKVKTSGQHQVVSGNVKDIQMYTCVYNPEKRANTMGNIIYPFCINIAGSTPAGEGLHLEVCLTKIHLRVSPNVIELLNRAYVTMYASSQLAIVETDTYQDYSYLWDYKPYKDSDYWFFRTEVAEEAYHVLGTLSTAVIGDRSGKTALNEVCFVRLPAIIITVEAGVGNKTLPMLLLESHFDGRIRNWSSELTIDATLTLEMGYYNSLLAVWEPLIERIEVAKDQYTTEYEPWQLKVEVQMNNVEDSSPVVTPVDAELQDLVTPQPRMNIEFSSTNNLEITLTKTALEVLTALGNAFAEAVSVNVEKREEESAPYKLINDSGLKVKVLLDKSSFLVYDNSTPKEIVLESGTEVPLELKPDLDQFDLELGSSKKQVQKYLNIKFVDMDCGITLNVIRADMRYFSLKNKSAPQNNWGIIASTVVESGVVVVTISGIVKIHNHFNIPVDVYYMTHRGNELECIATIKPGAIYNVPMKAIYTPTHELFFSVAEYSVTTTPFIWKELQSNINQTQVLKCNPKNKEELGHEEPFIIKAVGQVVQVFNENTMKHTMTSILCNVNLQPAIRFRNCLPIVISLTVQNINVETKIEPGGTLIVPNVTPGESYIILRLLSYLEREWSCVKDIQTNPSEFMVWTFESFQGTRKMCIDLGVHTLNESGAYIMSLYCPFWMLNKSEQNLSYRDSDENLNVLHHPADYKELILFSFNAKNFFGKKKASVRLANGGEWSDKFSIDVAGSSGIVTCKYQEKIYQLGIHIQLTYNGLTKQVTFTPYYVMINTTSFPIECQELDRPADPWTAVQPDSCAALWPAGDHDDKVLKLRVVGTEEVSAPFFISESHTTLLKLKNKYGGVFVDIQITEGAVYINFSCYDAGLAPALIINNTKDTLNIWEKETAQLRKLDPGHKFFYTWENPAGVRVLVWEAGNRKEIEDDLRKDGCGEYSIGDHNYVYWVSFLDGMQRILLFTCDRTVAENAQQANRFTKVDQEVTLSIHGIGLSLVNNIQRKEIMYLRIASSGIIWETCKGFNHRYKQMGHKDNSNMENLYQEYLKKRPPGRMTLDAKTEVDFDLNEMYKPHVRKIRRTFLTGFWMQMTTNPNMMQFHAKINCLQIDNQLVDGIFPVVLAPVPPPKTVANTDVHKPFAEVSVVQLLMKNSQVKQYKYFKILIQEFHIKLDLGFVTDVMNVFPQAGQLDLEAERQKFLIDVDLVNNPLFQHVSQHSQQEQKSFYDLLHFSPLKIHVSFSLAGADTQGAATPNIVNVLLQGLGVTLTDMQDVVFKLAYFEREYSFLTQKQLVSEASSHYIGQAVKQLYVLVLGLDVLGNPYGLVIGITKGVEDLFYEPFQGAIQGPGEFAEGLALGVRSLFGHTVGGAAGAVSRITGAMGKGLAALTFDKEYQRKRRDQLNKTPASVQEGFARSGKGLVMGVFDGITGVVRKPISGAKEEGVGGFFKGLGKGAVGLVTRPTAGVVDFASSSFDTVKRVTELGGEEVQRVRPARFIQTDCLVTPYNLQCALGHKLLSEMDKGKYANTDIYVYHVCIIPKKEVLLMTDKRIVYISHNDLFGGWQVNWSYSWSEIVIPPKIVPKGIAITPVEAKKKRANLFSSTDSGKTVLIPDRKICEEICHKIEELQPHI